jgi:hypothetical protein
MSVYEKEGTGTFEGGGTARAREATSPVGGSARTSAPHEISFVDLEEDLRALVSLGLVVELGSHGGAPAYELTSRGRMLTVAGGGSRGTDPPHLPAA